MEVYVEIELQTEDSYEKICVLLFLLRIKATFLIVHQPIYTQQDFPLYFPLIRSRLCPIFSFHDLQLCVFLTFILTYLMS